jgi:hypothetical protein
VLLQLSYSWCLLGWVLTFLRFTTDKPSPTTVVMIFQTVAKLINFDAKYKSIFQEAGLLHMLINLLKQFHVKNFARTSDVLGTPPVTQSESTTIALVPSPPPTTDTDLTSESGAHYTVVMDCITLLLEGVSENVRIFRESGCTRMLYSFVHSKEARPGALSVLQQLVQQDADQNQG